ncbi:hypothetical protein FLONG3_3912 [Fusarium longipes]|uniref:F-box domain-containing protein n=1 Tax=Fusarium longipes TaxID=694270 RepID=A0A395T151_9HYPO|nr:hypothetical protein FLONG3_3912 [Fusarium longipes]
MVYNILNLPDELLLAIVEYLKVSDIEEVRSSCKRLNVIASPFLYHTLTLSCHQVDLDVFNLVANNPLLIGGVRTLVIDDTTFPTCINSWAAYKNAVTLLALAKHEEFGMTLPSDDDTDSSDYEEDVADDSWGKFNDFHRMYIAKRFRRRYRRISRGHHENRLAHADVHALKKALPYFRSLRTLIVTNHTPYDGWRTSPAQEMWRFGRSFRLWIDKIPLYPRCDWLSWPEDLSATASLDWLDDGFCGEVLATGMPTSIPALLLPENSVEVEEYPDGYVRVAEHYDYNRQTIDRARRVSQHPSKLSRQDRVMHVALHVLEDAKICSQLRDFRVDASHDTITKQQTPGLPVSLFGHTSPLSQRFSHAFSLSNMRDLSLVMGNSNSHEYDKQVMSEGNITKMLASMPQLERLHLEPHGMATVGALPQDMTCSRLQRASFNCGEVDPEKLIKFLRRHQSSLERGIISKCNIHPDTRQTWEDVVDQINHLFGEGLMTKLFVGLEKVFVGKRVVACGSGWKTFSRRDFFDHEKVHAEDVHTWYLWKDGSRTIEDVWNR